MNSVDTTPDTKTEIKNGGRKMEKLSKVKQREIIDDFALEIAKAKRRGLPPTKTVVDFRNERRDGKERDIWYVPIELLRYRKDNGRISSDVLDYEKSYGLIDERSEESQRKIENFLKEKDREKTKELYNSMEHEGQREPAIITCDGFLINGNRRKMVMEVLREEHRDPRFDTMKVVILPGKDDEGGPPTLLEIEQIENRYQLQSEAKAEYYDFDRALSMRRKIDLGLTLEEQLRDDPIYAGLEKKEFKEEVKRFECDFLKPLECIDRYLAHLGRKGLYRTISTGRSDPEGRWLAFHDYYKSVYQKLTDEKKRIQLGICEDEIGKIEDVAFKIIRKREFSGLAKAHKIMRDFPKWIVNKDSKKELLKIVDIDLNLPREERLGENGKERDERTLDIIWARKNASKIINHVKKASDYFEHKREQETPIQLLEDALKKLKNENMNTKNINPYDLNKAMKLIKAIQDRAGELEDEFYHNQKEFKKLKEKYGRKT